ncbi:MAG: serine protease, partial [Corynebacterium matruchotii]
PLTRGTPTISYGMGGGKPQQRPGTIWFKFPQVIGKNYHTRVRHALVIRQPNNPAIPGDSGGPVMVNNQLVGLQSLILDPYGKNLGVATISLISPHLGEIRAAMHRLPPHPGE